MMSSDELMKIFDFILENKNIVIGDKGLFSRDTLIMLRGIIKCKIPNNFMLSEEQKKVLKESFLQGNKGFSQDTPLFIKSDIACIKKAVSLDVSSIDYLDNVPTELYEEVFKLAIDNDYILNENSPEFLIVDFNVCKNSILKSIKSADYVSWYKIDETRRNQLIDIVVNGGYLLNSISCQFLTECVPVVLSSIKSDMNTSLFISENIIYEKEVFKYLLTHGYFFYSEKLLNLPLHYLEDEEVLKEYLVRLELVHDTRDDELLDRYVSLYKESIKLRPTIRELNTIFIQAAEDSWDDYIRRDSELYQNVFGKICAELRSEEEYSDASDNLEMLTNMSSILEDRFDILQDAMIEYHKLYHSENEERMNLLKPYQDIIARMCALYIAIAKENAKKKTLNEFYDVVKNFFKLKEEHPHISKKIIQRRKMNRFKSLYNKGDKDTALFISQLYDKYGNKVEKNILRDMVRGFINKGVSTLSDIVKAPSLYNLYLRSQKVSKLVNRLNSGYIEYNGIEVRNYINYIDYDEKKGLYYYNGGTISNSDKRRIEQYIELEKVFNSIKKDIIARVKSINIDDCSPVESNYLNHLASLLPFNDEYFEFDLNKCNELDISVIYKSVMCPFRNFYYSIINQDQIYSNIRILFLNNYLVWLLMFLKLRYNSELVSYGINPSEIIDLVNNMDDIMDISKNLEYPLNYLDDYMTLNILREKASLQTMAILGKDLIVHLIKDSEYVDDSGSVVEVAGDLVARMVMKDKCTVPYISGHTLNYSYSMYDSQDTDSLKCGSYTDSCFKVGGNDNDFLHYCLLHKDGFIIKITDIYGDFIGKASGFRNGNAVYINQLRTIYDEGGNEYNGEYDSEREEIIETLKQAASDMIRESSNNKQDSTKLQYVFITKSYAFNDYEKVVSDRVLKKIGDNPMNRDCESWKRFYMDTPNLDESKNGAPFCTDFGGYSVICLAKASSIGRISASDIRKKDVPAVYDRPRNKVEVYTKVTEDVAARINKVVGINAYHEDIEFEPVDLTEVQCIFLGDNWFVVVKNKQIIELVLNFDVHAIQEMKIVTEILRKYLEKYADDINYEQLVACETDINKKLQLR